MREGEKEQEAVRASFSFLIGLIDKVEQSPAQTKQFLLFNSQIQSTYIPNTKAKL